MDAPRYITLRTDLSITDMSVNQNDTINYLISLDDQKYDALVKVVNIYRQASKDAGELLKDLEPVQREMSEAELDDMLIETGDDEK